jgi:hypothetical protein
VGGLLLGSIVVVGMATLLLVYVTGKALPSSRRGASAADGEPQTSDSPGEPSSRPQIRTSVRACCSALRQNAASAPMEQKSAYMAAASACDALVKTPDGRDQLGSLQPLLMGARVPQACRPTEP